MMMDLRKENLIELPLIIAGSNKFGKNPKISTEKTYNRYISDGWSVPTPGHTKIVDIDPLQEGRDVYTSTRGNFMIMVIGSGIYIIGSEIKKYGREIPIGDITENIAIKVGEIETFSGDVSIAENNAKEIAICDKKNIYVYNYESSTFQKAITDFVPDYISFQNGYILAAVKDEPVWRLSDINNAASWPNTSSHVGEFETKADAVRACIPIPGKGNDLFVMGSIVTEPWRDVGYKLFPYYKTTSFNIDYGCVNSATIAFSDEFIIWLAANEKSSPVIMLSNGGPPKQVSTDGINSALSRLSEPENSYGFLWKLDGHLFYQLTNKTAQVTFLYDINEDKFFFFTDESLNNHIAKKITFFANDYYFVSFVDGNLYRLGADIDTYDGKTIPRIRICNTLRLKNNKKFIARVLNFTLQQGDTAEINRIDISISYDGGITFGNFFGKELNGLAKRRNKFEIYDFGMANEMTTQFRFWGKGKFLCTDGYVGVKREDT